MATAVGREMEWARAKSWALKWVATREVGLVSAKSLELETALGTEQTWAVAWECPISWERVSGRQMARGLAGSWEEETGPESSLGLESETVTAGAWGWATLSGLRLGLDKCRAEGGHNNACSLANPSSDHSWVPVSEAAWATETAVLSARESARVEATQMATALGVAR